MSTTSQVAEILARLEKKGSKRNREGMARYGIVAKKVFGVSVADVRRLGKEVGPDHSLAQALWKTGWYEARLLAAFVAEPSKLKPAEMNRWAKDFGNWAVCDTLCFHLFDKTPHVWGRIEQWSTRREEFVKRAAFALLASVALHDKKETDQPFLDALDLIERAAVDDRNFVKKGVSWALRGIGHRNPRLKAAATRKAKELTEREQPAARWIGRDALRDLTR